MRGVTRCHSGTPRHEWAAIWAASLIGCSASSGTSPSDGSVGVADGGIDQVEAGPGGGEAAAAQTTDAAAAQATDAAGAETADAGTTDGQPIDAYALDGPTGEGEVEAAEGQANRADVVSVDATACAVGQPCTIALSGAKGVCEPLTGSCAPCLLSGGDAACKGAYGAGYLCVDLVCEPGQCHTSTDCNAAIATSGELCVNLSCAPCTSDAECQSDPTYRGLFPQANNQPQTVCNAAPGRCVSAACNQASTACGTSPNTNGAPSDICCADPNNPSQLWCAKGMCCLDSECPEGQSCLEGSCVSGACGQTGGSSAYVDPVQGVDAKSSSGAPRCAYKSVTYALAVTSLPIVIVTADKSPRLSAQTGETFPIVLPPGLSITSDSQDVTHVPVFVVEPGKVGIEAPSSNVALSYIALDGQNNQADTGIVIGGQVSQGPSSIRFVTVQGMLHAGIVTSDPGLLQMAAVISQQNGTASVPGTGLEARASAQVTLANDGPGQASSFGKNSQYGIYVTDGATVSLGISPNGIVAAADGCGVAGMAIEQNRAVVTQANLNALYGLHATGGSVGLQISAGSFVQLRTSVLAPNSQAAVSIGHSMGGGGQDDLASINLGDPTNDVGENVLGVAGASGTGICLAVTPGTTQLLAAGNTFASADCSSPAGGTLTRSGSCGAQTDLGGVGPGGPDIDVSNCQ